MSKCTMVGSCILSYILPGRVLAHKFRVRRRTRIDITVLYYPSICTILLFTNMYRLYYSPRNSSHSALSPPRDLGSFFLSAIFHPLSLELDSLEITLELYQIYIHIIYRVATHYTMKQASQLPPSHYIHHQDIPSSEDEEIEEEEAFDSDDEAKYGMFFANNKSSNDQRNHEDTQTDSEESSEEDEDNDGGQYMLDLLNQIQNSTEANGPGTTTTTTNNNTSLSLDALLQNIQETPGFGSLQSTLKSLNSQKSTKTPLSAVQSQRYQRQYQYQQETQNISNWLQAVQTNRQAETLDFRDNKNSRTLAPDITDTDFQPTTEFEQQMQQALEQLTESQLQRLDQQAQDDLGSNTLTAQEYQQRRAHLAQLRAHLLTFQQKRHYMKKIKSKKYRRIRKKQKERQNEKEFAEQDSEQEDATADANDSEEFRRIQERMTLAHRNTGKWAKRMLRRKQNIDLDTRRALSAQVQKHEDLIHKMKENPNEYEASSDSDNDDNLVASTEQIIQDTMQEQQEQPKGLFQLSFMKKGMEKQRQRVQQEAKELLQELRENEELEEDPEEDDEETKTTKRPNLTARTLTPQEKKDSQTFTTTQSAITMGFETVAPIHSTASTITPAVSEYEAKTTQMEDPTKPAEARIPEDSPRHKAFMKKEKNKAAEVKGDVSSRSDTNPWLTESSIANKKTRTKSATTTAAFDIDKAIKLVHEEDSKDDHSKRKSTPQDKDDNAKALVHVMTQEELVRQAFATQSHKDAEDDFAREKERTEIEEDPTLKKSTKDDKTVSGWGSWTGEGAPPPPPRRSKGLPPHLQPPEKRLPKRARADAKKPNVIISEKRAKKTADAFMLSEIPYPYTSREDYERAMLGGLGPEYNTLQSFKSMTRPEILTRTGKMIQPLSKKVKVKRAPAKF